MSMELLAPAADPEVFRAVVDAGADAVYFGGTSFGARAGAASFDPADTFRAVTYAHLRGRKAYLTVNTLLKNPEMEEQLYLFLKDYYEAGVDGVIVQDLGIVSMIRRCFPDWRISASTQMTAASVEGARFLESLGVRRMVAPRELSVSEMKEITSHTGIELEVFVHGALCVCYSGQCLMSSMIGGRSGNRGRCAQTCRLPFAVEEDHRPVSAKGPYILSLKDLCGLRDLPELDAAGVKSLKIEGRLKGVSYAAGVTASYRRILDLMAEGRPLEKALQKEEKILLSLGNRNGFTDRYFHAQNGVDMVSFADSSHHHEQAVDRTHETEKIPVQGRFTAVCGQPVSLEVSALDHPAITVFGPVAQAADKRPLTEEDIRKQLNKTKDTPFEFENLSLDCRGDLFLPVSALNALRRDALSKLLEELVLPKRAEAKPFEPLEEMEHKDHLGNTDASDPDDESALPPGKTQSPAKTAEEMDAGAYRELITVCTEEQLRAAVPMLSGRPFCGVVIPASYIDGLSDEAWEQVKEDLQRAGIVLLMAFPRVIRERARRMLVKLQNRMADCDGVLCGSIDGVGFLESLGVDPAKIVADTNLYTWSDRTLAFWRSRGIGSFCAPLELNAAELSHRSREGAIYTVYGRPALMHMANCIREDTAGCDHSAHVYELVDRKKARFPVRNDCRLCMNTIYNSLPVSVLGELQKNDLFALGGRRLDFTVETAAQTKEVLACYLADRPLAKVPVTRGHYRRGVE